jgi:predicted transcriptional regulator
MDTTKLASTRKSEEPGNGATLIIDRSNLRYVCRRKYINQILIRERGIPSQWVSIPAI